MYDLHVISSIIHKALSQAHAERKLFYIIKSGPKDARVQPIFINDSLRVDMYSLALPSPKNCKSLNTVQLKSYLGMVVAIFRLY